MAGPSVVILAGPNGAGKSTGAPALLAGALGVTEFVNADDIARGLSAFNPAGVSISAGRVALFLWLPSAEFALARVAERVREGGHGVPEETVRRRYDRGLGNFFGLYQNMVSTWRLYDTSDSQPRMVAGRTSRL